MPRRERHIRLTEDPDVKRWYESFDSQKTAKDRLRQLGLFCERAGTTPKGYVRLGTFEACLRCHWEPAARFEPNTDFGVLITDGPKVAGESETVRRLLVP